MHRTVPGLCLTRKRHETIMIGDDITIHVNEINSSDVRLRIVAPEHVRVDRGEVRAAMIKSGDYTPGQGDVVGELVEIAEMHKRSLMFSLRKSQKIGDTIAIEVFEATLRDVDAVLARVPQRKDVG